jgi:AraC family transcriptional regulator
MFAVGKGKSTGKIVNSLENTGAIINTVHYSVEECSQGVHYHENPHICFLFQGSDLENRNNQIYQRKTGDIYFYYTGEKHASVSRKSLSKHTNIEFSQTFLRKYNISESQIENAVKDNLDARFLILKIQQEMMIDDDCSHLAIQTLLLSLVSSRKLNEENAPSWIKKLDELLNDRWNEQLTLEELAAATQKYPTTISKHFRKYFFCTLGEYLRKIRINKSLPLIKNSEMSLTEIALQCGFSDQSHFTRNFKEITGFLPKEFRRI